MLPLGKKMIITPFVLLFSVANACEDDLKRQVLPTSLTRPPLEELKAAKAKIVELEYQNTQLKKTQERFVHVVMSQHQNLAESLIKEANGWGWGWWLRKSPSTLSSIAQADINQMYQIFEAMHDKNAEKAKLTLLPFYTWQRDLLSTWVKEHSPSISPDSPVFLALLTFGDDAYARGVYLGEDFYKAFFQNIERLDLYEEHLEKLKITPKPVNLLSINETAPQKKRVPPAPKFLAKTIGKKTAPLSINPNTKTSAITEVTPQNKKEIGKTMSSPFLPGNIGDQIKNVRLKPTPKTIREKEEDTMESALKKAFEARRMAIAGDNPDVTASTAAEDEASSSWD